MNKGHMLVFKILIAVPCMQATDVYDGSATLSTYNKGLKLMRAGYTIYLVSQFALRISETAITSKNSTSNSSGHDLHSAELALAFIVKTTEYEQVYVPTLHSSFPMDTELNFPD